MTTSLSNRQPLDVAVEPLDQPIAQAGPHVETAADRVEINRLLVAAVVSRRFCQLLLGNPVLALANGYRGQPFRLTAGARSRILAIRARSLPEFARQLVTAESTAPVYHLQQLRLPHAERIGRAVEA